MVKLNGSMIPMTRSFPAEVVAELCDVKDPEKELSAIL
jgi:hypothetical protein